MCSSWQSWNQIQTLKECLCCHIYCKGYAFVFLVTPKGGGWVTSWRGWKVSSYKAGGFKWYKNSLIWIWNQIFEFGATYLSQWSTCFEFWRWIFEFSRHIFEFWRQSLKIESLQGVVGGGLSGRFSVSKKNVPHTPWSISHHSTLYGTVTASRAISKWGFILQAPPNLHPFVWKV